MYRSDVEPGTVPQTSTMITTPTSEFASKASRVSNDMGEGTSVRLGSRTTFDGQIRKTQSSSPIDNAFFPHSVGVQACDARMQSFQDGVISSHEPLPPGNGTGLNPHFAFVFDASNRGQQPFDFGLPDFDVVSGQDRSTQISDTTADLGSFDTTGFGFDISSFSFNLADFSNLFDGGTGNDGGQ
jgi:hypothetical protein